VTISEILREASRLGVRLKVHAGGKLQYVGRKAAVLELLPELREHRDELVATLPRRNDIADDLPKAELVEALQARGQAEPSTPTRLWLDFTGEEPTRWIN